VGSRVAGSASQQTLIENYVRAVLTIMSITDLTPLQLSRATSINQKLDALNKELCRFLNGALINGATSKKKRTMSAAVKRKIAAAQKARWAKLRRV
jgi:hypothetical protein